MNLVRLVRKSHKLGQQVVAFSISYDRADAAPRGLGPEHLRETLLQIARPILRAQAAIAYGGNFDPVRPPGCNFTLDLLGLIREEQQERSASNSSVRGLFNFQAWPFYLSIDREKEAEWINCCQVVRVTQQMAGLENPLPDEASEADRPRRLVHGAVCLSAMRRAYTPGAREYKAQEEVECPAGRRQGEVDEPWKGTGEVTNWESGLKEILSELPEPLWDRPRFDLIHEGWLE